MDIKRFSFYNLFVLNFSKVENFRQMLIIIIKTIIMYSFMCYFSKLEHMAHYKTQSKQTCKHVHMHAYTHANMHTQFANMHTQLMG